MPFVQQDVLRLDVTVDDVVPMRVVKRVGHLDGDVKSLVDRDRGALSQAVAQRLPLHHRHHEVQEAVRLTGVVERQDVRVVQWCSKLDFSQKAFPAERFCDIVPQHLDRDFAGVFDVTGQIDRGHSAHTELAIEAIMGGKRVGECRGGAHAGTILSRRVARQTRSPRYRRAIRVADPQLSRSQRCKPVDRSRAARSIRNGGHENANATRNVVAT